jgi:heme/copper-type cytochrome/quinol oxidase subunit 2
VNFKKFLVWSTLGLAMFLAAFVPLPAPDAAPGDKLFRIEASQYAFSPAQIKVHPGDRVTIELFSTDVVHGLYIDGYDLSVEADPGQSARLEFTADKAGSYRMRCSITCGAMHPFMIGKIQVGKNNLLWRAIGLAVIAASSALVLFFYRVSPRSVEAST